jgi:ATP-dependent RNA helicase DHX8/PRP22
VLDFGCFVELDGFIKKEGLVHVAQIEAVAKRDAKQLVRRGQQVKVKVISIAGSKLALSMKEVDQRTGEDLLPQRSKLSSQSTATRLEISNPAPPTAGSRQQDNRGFDMR